MRIVSIDQLDRKIELPDRPERIISLVPSQTELLYDLGLGDRVVGVTKFCVHPPEWRKSKSVIGGTKNIQISKIRSLLPDLVIANKEENELAQIAEIEAEFPTWISDVHNLEDALEMILSIGTITETREKSLDLIEKIKAIFSSENTRTPRSCVYLIWSDPLMTVNDDTFIHDMLVRSGLDNVFANRRDSRYPQITLNELIEAAPELLLLSTEPFPFQEKHLQYFRTKLPSTRVELADGEMFSWYGSRLCQFDLHYFS